MEKTGWWIILVICVILLCVSTWSYFRYTYHERDESYAYVNGIYIKCDLIPTGANCSLPDGRKVTITKQVIFNSTLK